jgi:signal transduction histidine kinase
MSSALRVNAEPHSGIVPISGRREARRGIRLAALRVPLVLKLVGANIAIICVLIALALYEGLRVSTPAVVGIAVLAVAAHAALIMVALHPIRELESVARRVWHGDYAARVEQSSVADNEVLRVGSMFNILLDGLESDRARMRELARDVIAAGDRERSALARELHDSTAQRVAALQFELSAAAREASDPLLAQRIMAARDAAEDILEELRQLSQTVHSAVLDDLGLAAALKRLARQAANGNAIDFDVDADGGARLSPTVESALYRVAQEAVYNATRHAAPRRVRIHLRRDARQVVLQIHDDGKGFDVPTTIDRPGSRGLAAMRERLALVDGRLAINSAPSGGTTVTATVPLS